MLICRSIIVALCTVISTTIPDFLQFLDVAGAIGSASVCFIMPPIMYMVAFPKKVPKAQKVGLYAMILFGIFGGSYSVVRSLIAFEHEK